MKEAHSSQPRDAAAYSMHQRQTAGPPVTGVYEIRLSHPGQLPHEKRPTPPPSKRRKPAESPPQHVYQWHTQHQPARHRRRTAATSPEQTHPQIATRRPAHPSTSPRPTPLYPSAGRPDRGASVTGGAPGCPVRWPHQRRQLSGRQRCRRTQHMTWAPW